MMSKLSLQTRRELVAAVRLKYQQSDWKVKSTILDGFIAATGYQRKYAINLLNKEISKDDPPSHKRTGRQPIYDGVVQQALITVWQIANQICAKRLVPFLPELVKALERHGHLSLPEEVRKKLLSISAATADRVLKPERHRQGKGKSTTRPGALLKKQIQVRTFADWDDVQPGFLEGDLVAHCGEYVDGSFLNTFVLTDIATGWTEFLPLLCKSAAGVVRGIDIAKELLPFELLGIDTDNGSEFINYELLNFCRENKITFTRSRPYKKNDQAHVEEKNGSIVRRMVGYDRYEGSKAWHALADLYAVLRLYVNYFQPSLKLLSKKRNGSKTTKKYDKAKTPFQRIIGSSLITEKVKNKMKVEYEKLDPVYLLKKLSELQENFWEHASNITRQQDPKISKNVDMNISPSASELPVSNELATALNAKKKPNRQYRRTPKSRKKMPARTWRTREDPFEHVWPSLRQQLELDPDRTAKSLIDSLVEKYPEQFNTGGLRTLQRRVAAWRLEQANQAKAEHLLMSRQDNASYSYLSLVLGADNG